MDVGTSAVAGRESGVIDKIFLPQIEHLIKRIGITYFIAIKKGATWHLFLDVNSQPN